MRRLAWSQLRFRGGRALALLAGMLVAATAFTVLTAAARTAQIRTIGTVSAHFRPAYDILVRPAGARSTLESATGTVQPDFLSGIYGGITMAQYHQIQRISGVSVAAPIAMVGYGFMNAIFPVWLPRSDVSRPGRQLYRVDTTWVSAGGASRVRQPPQYVYVTPNRVQYRNRTSATSESLPGGGQAVTCPAQGQVTSPFSYRALASAACFSTVNGQGAPPGTFFFPDFHGRPGFAVDWQFPMLLAAVDPAAEAKLDGLNRALAFGKYLPESYGNAAADHSYLEGDSYPVLAATGSGIGEYAQSQVEELASPAAPPQLTTAAMRRDATRPGHPVLSSTTTARQAYDYLLGNLRAGGRAEAGVASWTYWQAGPVRYRRASDGDLVAETVHNPVSGWGTGGNVFYAPLDNAGTQYRTLRQHAITAPHVISPVPQLTGTFDQTRIAAFDPLSRVPLGPYQPTVAAPASAASRRALGGRDLLPSMNLGGYVSQPMQLITTLAALPTVESAKYSGDARLRRAPISVIRVRVAGVTGPDPVSLDRIKEVAEKIELRTHLTVDIVAGSSPAPTTVELPAGRFGYPALRLSEDWVKKGVAISILNAVDRSSVALFVLILVVCALFVANSATAAVRSRRQELGVLTALGWTRPRLFTAVLGEVVLIGLAAGVLAAVASPPLAAALGLHASTARAALAIPVAIAVALAAGAAPAWLAARADPVASARPPVLPVRRARQPRRVTGLAVVNVLRTPGRTLIGALSLAVGVMSLTLLVAVTLAFRGAIVGTLLGTVVTVQVRGVDYVAVAATVTLGVLAVADAVVISITERAAELATIRAFGWPERALHRLVITEGALTGLAGSVAGAAAGLVAAAVFAGQLPPLLFAAAAAAVVAGVVVTSAAALLPAQLLHRLPAAQLLAEE